MAKADREQERQKKRKVKSGIRHVRLSDASAAMWQENKRYRIAAEESSEIILDYDVLTGAVYCVTERAAELYGVPRKIDDGVGFLREHNIIDAASEEELQNAIGRIRKGERRVSCGLQMLTASGQMRWCELCMTAVEGSQIRHIIGVLKDNTLQREAELRSDQQKLYRGAIEKDALLSYEADMTNRRMLSGVEKIFIGLGIPYSDNYEDALKVLVENLVCPEDQAYLMNIFSADALLDKFEQGINKIQAEYRRIGKGRERHWVRGIVYMIFDSVFQIVRLYYYVNDINEEKLRELRLQEQAEKDMLTGLLNKGTAELAIRRSVAAAGAEPENGVCAFFIVDLDNFKSVNDQLGHAFGDAVLSEMARKLHSVCRSGDIAGRIGGDEFVLYFNNLPDVGAVEYKAEAICNMFHNSFTAAEGSYKISGTVGVSILPHHGRSFDELYRKADLALYEAKAHGKDTWRIYSNEMGKEGRRRAIPVRAGIDYSHEKPFSANMVEYVFRILYEAQDLFSAITGVLELVAKHFGFCRGYIYEIRGVDCSCVLTHQWSLYEWFRIPETLQILEGSVLEDCRQRLSDTGYLVAQSLDDMPQWMRQGDGMERFPFCVQCTLSGNGSFEGFVGFDSTEPEAELSKGDLSDLHGVMQMLGVFLAEKYDADQMEGSEAVSHAVTSGLRGCTYIIDPETYILHFVNQNTRAIIPQAVPGTHCYETVRGRAEPCGDCPMSRMKQNDAREYHTQMYLDRYKLWAKINASLIRRTDGKEYGLFNGYDFSEYRKMTPGRMVQDRNLLSAESSLYQTLRGSSDNFIYMCDVPKNLFYFPKAMVEEFDLPGQIIVGAETLWAGRIHENDREIFMKDFADILQGKSERRSQEYRVRNREGNWVWVRCRGYLERDSAGKPALFAGVITNLGNRDKETKLSGLPDKLDFEQDVKDFLSCNPKRGVMLFLGLDNFKYVNNFYGWEYGDEVLRDAGQRMQDILGQSAQVYRLDGDKFGVFFPGEGRERAEAYYQAVHSVFQRRSFQGERRYYCTVSGGCADFDGWLPDFGRISRQAEYALEYSKTEGKNCISFYDEGLMSGREREIGIIARLQQSVDSDFEGFELHFQPQLEPSTHRVKSAEALLRWNCEEYGSIPPDEFIPLLEQSGMIRAVGKWVLLQAAETCRQWRKLRPDFTINVNVSFAQFQDRSFFSDLSEMVQTGQVEPDGIHLELTESCIASGSQSLHDMFRNLRALGFSIEMDDFGTGYSSLEILKNAPADVVKIDHTFVMDITKSEFDATFIRFIVSLCHSVGIKVCLEGVETWAEYYMVEPMELDLIQGFLFGRPQSKEDFEKRYLGGVVERRS